MLVQNYPHAVTGPPSSTFNRTSSPLTTSHNPMSHGQRPGLPRTNGSSNLLPAPKINAVQMIERPRSRGLYSLHILPTPLLLLLPRIVLLILCKQAAFHRRFSLYIHLHPNFLPGRFRPVAYLIGFLRILTASLHLSSATQSLPFPSHLRCSHIHKSNGGPRIKGTCKCETSLSKSLTCDPRHSRIIPCWLNVLYSFVPDRIYVFLMYLPSSIDIAREQR